MRTHRIRIHICLALTFLVLSHFSFIRSAQAAYTITGTIFRDYNANGTQEGAEPGVGGVQIAAYNTKGLVTSTSSAPSGQLGSYTLAIPQNEGVRVEISEPAHFFAGANGSNNNSSVVFVSSAQTLDYGLSLPGDYCQNNPDLATNCYVQGDQQSNTGTFPRAVQPVMLRTAYTASGTNPALTTLAFANQIGTTWGMAYQRSSKSLFASAFYKRHAGLGPNGAGAIYILRNANTASPVASLFLDLNALFPNIAGTDTRTAADYIPDRDSFNTIGKIALGDLEISDDDQTLWAVSLFTRELIRIPIGIGATVPVAAEMSRFPIPKPVGAGFCPSADDIRPFGLGYHNGLLFVGMVCSAESTQNADDLRALIYSFEPLTNSFSAQPVVNIALNYPRLCVDYLNGVCPPGREAEWRPWQNANTLNFSAISSVDFFVSYPQPWLTDIVFDGDTMILGLRDRFGDQSGKEALPPDPNDQNNYTGLVAGDILRLCANGSSWALEANGSCGGVSTTGANTGQGPGNGEFYHGENHPFHDEVVLGGLAQVPQADRLVSTAFDPIFNPANTFESGFIWLSNTTGLRLQEARLRQSVGYPVNFGKANGLGDIEALCDAAPVEIGNRVWFDTNNDGVQAPDEAPIAGVKLELVDALGKIISTAITDANGNYYFSNDPNRSAETSASRRYNITELKAGQSYVVRIALAQDVLTGTLVTKQTNDSSTLGIIRDSDGNNTGTKAGPGAVGYTQVSFVVTGIGQNNHTYDFGFYKVPTAIVLSQFTVTPQANGTLLKWWTSYEVNTFGFKLMRSNTSRRSDATLITPTIITAQGPGYGYSFLDTGAQGQHYYWLVELDMDGNPTEYGPFTMNKGPAGSSMLWLPAVVR